MIPVEFLGFLALGIPAEIAAAWGSDGGKIRVAMQFVTTPHGLVFDFGEDRTLTVSRTLDRGAAPVVIKY